MTLTPAQQTQICNDLGKYEANNISKAGLCKFEGIFAAAFVLASDPSTPDATLQSACSQAVTQCNSQPPDTSGGTCDFSGVSTCSADATVAELNTCAMDEVAATNTAFNSLPACAAINATYLNANDPSGGLVEPASCTALAAKCPGINLSGG